MTTELRIGAKVRCLAAPRWAPPEYHESMPGQIGVVIGLYPGDEESEAAVGIQYPVSPYSDNTIAQDFTQEGVTWERVK